MEAYEFRAGGLDGGDWLKDGIEQGIVGEEGAWKYFPRGGWIDRGDEEGILGKEPRLPSGERDCSCGTFGVDRRRARHFKGGFDAAAASLVTKADLGP
jgi:hypothetical protein